MPIENNNWHFGVLPFTGTGHMNPLIALSQEIAKRGHKVTFIERVKVEDRVRKAGLGFAPIPAPPGASRHEPRSTRFTVWDELSTLRSNLMRVTREIDHYLEKTPPALIEAGVSALLIDEIAITGPTIAQWLRLPYFLLSTSVPHCFGWAGSSWLSGYRYSRTAASWLHAPLLEVSASRMRGPIRSGLDRFRLKAGLGPVRRIAKHHPCLAHIAQLPECLDLPRTSLPRNFHYTHPWLCERATQRVDFPWNQLDGRQVVYVTLGTTRSAQPAILRMIAAACSGLDVQLVISLGNRFDAAAFARLPGRPVVVNFAPQRELLKIAALVISHGGANTAFETLMEGKPQVIIPLAYDQPAIAARLRRLHVAEVLPVMRLSPDRIRVSVTKVLHDPHYRRAAARMQSALRSTNGPKRAADIIEVELAGYSARQQLALRTEPWIAGPASSQAGVMAASTLQR